MPLSWNEIRIRASRFADEWKDATNEQADKQTFWNEFFEVFGVTRKTFAQYEHAIGRLGKAKGFIDLFWPGVLVVEHKSWNEPLDAAYDQAMDYGINIPDQEKPRYIITSDFRTIRLYDLETIGKRNMWEISLKDLPKKADLFGFIAGYQRQEIVEEDPVNRKAAEKLAQLHDQLKAVRYEGHDLEVLLVRLLFCLFAEDSGIFKKGSFYEFVYNRTDIDGSDLGAQLNSFFETLNTPKEKRQSSLDEALINLPYVNGRLFEERISTPSFDHKMRDSILDSAHKLNWSEISPAVFGAMFQGVMNPKQRRNLGAHYTSEQNIQKVIRPLFLDELWAEFNNVKNDRRLLYEFHDKLSSLTFMDPACGCGNFLVVSYRELRQLELGALKVLHTLRGIDMRELKVNLADIVKCNVDQFYGIEIEEFPAQIAQVALWLTDIQMNNEAADYFGRPLVRLPLVSSPTIINDDALKLDWEQLIPSTKLDFIFGNPPFSGSRTMDSGQKEILKHVAHDIRESGFLDFVVGWYFKAVEYIQGTDIEVAFVSTNSISQGEQVGIVWEYLYEHGAKINFAHRTFKWTNEASGQAAVYCIIIGFSLHDRANKIIFDYPKVNSDPHVVPVTRINPYLIEGPSTVLRNRQEVICDVPNMNFGNMPRDGGHLVLNPEERSEILQKSAQLSKFIKPYIGAKEFLHNEERYCLWLVNAAPEDITSSTYILDRLKRVKEFRLASKAASTRNMATTPSLFAQRTQPNSEYIFIPGVSSENRDYIPMGYFNRDTIASNAAFVLPGARLYHFGVLESKMHMAWVRHVAGRLKSDFRYSKDIVYNNFPWAKTTKIQENRISKLAQEILKRRAQYPESSLADLYNPLIMPEDLLKAHQELDLEVDKIYQKEKFESDAKRMELLLELYQEYSKKV